MRSFLVLLAGGLMVLSSIAHSVLGWPAQRSELRNAGAQEDLIGGLAVGWHFGSAAMLTFGAIVLVGGLKLRKGDLSGVVPVQIIAACYVLFGLAALFYQKLNPHFVGSLSCLLAGLPVLGRRTSAPVPGK